MKKTRNTLPAGGFKQSSKGVFGRKLKQSAAVLASTLMASSPAFAIAADLIVDGTSSNIAERVYTITSGSSVYVDSVLMVNGGQLNGEGTLNANDVFNFSEGSASVSLSGSANLLKTGTTSVLLTGANNYYGDTEVQAGTLQLGDGVTGSISASSNVVIRDSARFVLNLANGSTFANDVTIDNNVHQGNFVVTSSGTTTISGIISGGGGFYTDEGGGHTILTGSNTSTGAYGVEDGTLQIGDGVSGSISSLASVYTHATGRLLLNLADGSIFSNNVVIDGGLVETMANGTNTLTGVLSGTGAFTQSGSGTTILTGANTYTGQTLVTKGILQIGDGLTIGSSIAASTNVTVESEGLLGIYLADEEVFSNNVLNNGVVGSRVDSGKWNEFSGQITGTGGFLKVGEGTTYFTNDWDESNDHAHYYSGDTRILQGALVVDGYYSLSLYSKHIVSEGAVLQLNDDQNILALAGAGEVILNTENLYIGYDWDGNDYVKGVMDDSAVFSGVISGTGNIKKGGYGTSVLSGTSTFEGELEVESGAVLLTGALTQAGVDNKASFYGNGYVGGSIGNKGTVYAGIGSTPGTLTIAGNFSQDNSDSTVYAGVASRNKYSRLVIGGTSNLQGALLLIGHNGYKAKRDDKLTILTAGGGVYGKFDKFDSQLAKTMLTPKVVYKDNAVVIEFDQEKFSKLSGLTPNEKSVARALDKDANRKSLNKLFDKLNELSIGEVPNALAKLSPEQYAAIFNIGFANSQIQFTNIERRLDDVRRGNAAFSSNGLALTNSHGSLNYSGMPIVNEKDGLTLAGFDGKSLVGKQTVAPVISESRWSFFATGSGEWTDVDSTRNVRASDFRTGGVNIGADYRVNNNLVVGITAGYTNTSSDLFDGGKVDVNSGRGAIYGTWFADGFYVNALAGGAYNSYDTKRSTFGGKAHASPDGGEFDALLGGGYDFCFGGLTIGPVGSFQYTYIGLSSFTESGSDAPLHFASQHQESLKSLLGLKAAYTFNIGSVAITPEVRAQWQHEYLDSTAAVESSFASGGSTFTVNGPEIGRDGVLIDAGVSAQVTSSVAVYAYYTGDFGRKNYTSNGVNGGFRINF